MNTPKEIADKLRATKSESKRKMLDEAADMIEDLHADVTRMHDCLQMLRLNNACDFYAEAQREFDALMQDMSFMRHIRLSKAVEGLGYLRWYQTQHKKDPVGSESRAIADAIGTALPRFLSFHGAESGELLSLNELSLLAEQPVWLVDHNCIASPEWVLIRYVDALHIAFYRFGDTEEYAIPVADYGKSVFAYRTIPVEVSNGE